LDLPRKVKLKRMKLVLCLRLKANEYVEVEVELLSQLSKLGLCRGMQCFFQRVRVTKAKGFGKFNVAAKWQQKRTAPLSH
jgi:hypothetical protein